jgi:type IV secretory pathway VirB3-like protein
LIVSTTLGTLYASNAVGRSRIGVSTAVASGARINRSAVRTRNNSASAVASVEVCIRDAAPVVGIAIRVPCGRVIGACVGSSTAVATIRTGVAGCHAAAIGARIPTAAATIGTRIPRAAAANSSTARVRASVFILHVAVVAFLLRIDDSIAAAFLPATRAAPIAGTPVTVVAFLPKVDDAIAAILELAVRAAAVACVLVAVVALLILRDDAVATCVSGASIEDTMHPAFGLTAWCAVGSVVTFRDSIPRAGPAYVLVRRAGNLGPHRITAGDKATSQQANSA